MATQANEEGVGGKFRRRPFRRVAPTPYARPPTALRGVRRGGYVAEGGGWISKLVDPASRLIANGASKLFSSVFRKQLTTPTRFSEADYQSRAECFQPPPTVPLSEVQNGSMEGDNQTNNSDSDVIAELERVFGQKTFTRVESDRLAELLRSRTAETVEHENNDKIKGKAGLVVPENGIGSSGINENNSVSRGGLTLAIQNVQEEAASPAELAKAYMGSRASKDPSSVRGLRNQVFQEDSNLPSIAYTSKQLDLSVAPRSVIRFSGITEQPEHGCQTAGFARTPGRSAIYRMSRSPYFNVNPTPNVQVGETSQGGYSHRPLSRWTPGSMKSSGKQLLKRGSVAVEDEFGSVGPIRRIRQKSNLMSPSKEAFSSRSGKYVNCPSTPFPKDISKGSMSVQNPLMLDEGKNRSISQIENGISNSTMLPPQSSEKSHKLFQQLDKLFPSPKGKPSELKSIARDDSPSKLTLDMLHGSALRSMEEINSSNFFSMQENGTLDTASDSQLSNIRNSHCQKLDIAKENGPLKSDELEVKSASEANGVSNVPTPSKNAMSGARSENIVVSNSIALPAVKKPGFRITAPEDLLDLDDDEYLPRPSTTPNDDADTKKSNHNGAISETTVSDKPPTYSSQSMPISSSIYFRKADNKPFVQPVVTEKDNGFVFPVTSDPCMLSQPPPTPTMPTPQLDKPDMRKEHASPPKLSFGSEDANTSTVSSATISVNDTSGINLGERSGSELPSATSVGTCIGATTDLAEGSTVEKNGKQMAGDTFNSSVHTVTFGMPASSTPAAFSFGVAASTGLSNDSLDASSSTCLAPSTASTSFSEGPVSSVLAISSSSSISPSVSSAAATFSTASAFQFGSAMSTSAPASVSQALDKSNSDTIGANSVKASRFDMSCTMAQGASSVFPRTGSSSSPDDAKTVSIFSSTSLSTSSSLFSSMTRSGSSVATSTAYPSTESNHFGFNASSSIQSIGSSPSFAPSSQNSTATIFGANGGSLSSGPSIANIFSQNSTASSFGATNGSVFGTQSKPCGSETTQMSQGSTSQFVSFTSSPSFGLANSSLGSLGISPFGSATPRSNPFASSPGVTFSSGANSSSSFAPASTTGPSGVISQGTTSSIFTANSNSSISVSTGLSFKSSASGSNIPSFTFGSSSSLSTSPFTVASSSGPSSTSLGFGLSSGASSSGSSSTSFTFGLSSGSSTSPFTVGSSSGSSGSSFTFGAASGSSSSPFTMGSSSGSSSTPFVFGSSSGSVFSASSSPALAFGAQKPAFGFGSGSPGNDQMNVEDSMTDVANNAQNLFVPTFGQSANPPAAPPSFVFGAPSAQPVAPPAFQFGGLQNPSAPQNPSPFQPAGNADFNLGGGSFSLGSGGGDKSSRKFVKVKRGLRKK